MASLKLDVVALHGALDSKRRANNLSWGDVGRETDLNPALFTRMKTGGGKPDVNSLLTLCRWLAQDATNFAVRAEGFLGRTRPSPLTFNAAGLDEPTIAMLTALAECAERIANRGSE